MVSPRFSTSFSRVVRLTKLRQGMQETFNCNFFKYDSDGPEAVCTVQDWALSWMRPGWTLSLMGARMDGLHAIGVRVMMGPGT